jgi:MFS transporter, PAT family, solute carrier family 33 (acetyl-CoA transportor), member 1
MKKDALKTKREAEKTTIREDMPNLLLLVLLYTFQGLPMGLFLSSIPLLFKKYLSYQEIGVVSMATMPYSFKVFWSPIVELYYWPSFGQRKSWVVPTQLLGCCILFYLSGTIDQMLMNKEVYKLTAFLILNTFIITC